jgi:hypothetical protein
MYSTSANIAGICTGSLRKVENKEYKKEVKNKVENTFVNEVEKNAVHMFIL